MKKVHVRDIQKTLGQAQHQDKLLPEKNLTPTITGCDSGQTTDRKEEESIGKTSNNRATSENDRHQNQPDKQPSEIRLRLQKNLQPDLLNMQSDFMDHYLV